MLQSSSSSSLSVRPQASSPERPLVLVVDPDRSARAVLEVALSRDGFDVWSVETAEQGLGVLRRGRTPDVIVLESDLRGGDGFSFCAELRGSHKTARVPVVLLAKAGDPDAANLAEVVGVDEYVQKPAFARDVAALVRFELVRHRGTTGHALRFHSKTLPAAHLLRALLTSARSGTFSLADGAAAISFRDGSIVQARFAERWGIDAVVRSLALTSQEYTVSLDPVSVSTGFHCSLRDFVAQVLPRLSRWNMLTMRSLPLDAVLAVDFARLAQALPSMPDDVNRIVQLFDGRRRVHQVLVDSAFDEVLTLEVGTRLYLMGVIGPVTPQTDSPEAPRQAPRLFEPRSAEAEHLMRQLFDGVAEIRSDEVEPAQVAESDWAMVGAPSDLDVDDPAGGWTAAALPDAHLLEGLEDDLAKKLSAFNVPTIVEPQESPSAHAPVVGFARGAVEAEIESLEAALRNATGDEGAALAEFKSEPAEAAEGFQQNELLDQDPTPPSATRSFGASDRQDRIITPVLTRAVSVEPLPLAEATHALTAEGSVVSTTAEQVANIAAPRVVAGSAQVAAPVVLGAVKVAGPAPIPVKVVKDDPEALFFAGDSAEADASAFEDTLPAHASPAKQQGRVGLLIGLALAAVVVAVGFEWLLNAAPSLPEAPVSAALTAPPIKAPVEAAPLVAPLAPVAVEEVAAEPEPVDVSEPLADGVRAYQRGEYQKAVSVLEQVVADEPGSVQGWLVLGQARYDLGDAAGARAATVRVLELDPKNAKVHILLATLAHDASDKPAMRAELEKYLELEPNGEHAAEAKALLAGR